jgi:hypothetical protein
MPLAALLLPIKKRHASAPTAVLQSQPQALLSVSGLRLRLACQCEPQRLNLNPRATGRGASLSHRDGVEA